ncbi:MAG: hypothetical protein ACOVLK_08350, partial [Terrimicrobiaceae bacterium]
MGDAMNTQTVEFLRSESPQPSNAMIVAWVEEVAALTQPSKIHWCDGSGSEDKAMREAIVASR